MSDYNSSLPIRTQNDGDVVSKIGDGTNPAQYLKVNVDGSISIDDNAGSITVDAANLDIRDLVFATDKVDASGSEVSLDATTLAALESITVQNGAGGSAVNIQDGGNSITVDASDLDIRDLAFATDKVDVGGSIIALDAPTLAALESITVQNAGGGSAVNIQDGGNSITVDGTVELGATTLAALESITVVATDLDIRDLAAATDSVSAWVKDSSGAAISESNPLWVQVSESAGSEIHNYLSSSAVASAASANHDYTAGAEFNFKKALCSASGKAKFEVQVETGVASGTFATKAVQFNSTANPNCEFNFIPPMIVATGVKVRIIRTNKDNQSQDLYSTIMGLE